MPITLRTTNVYGVERIYPTSLKQALALTQLTGHKTLSYRDLDALYTLGVEVEWITA